MTLLSKLLILFITLFTLMGCGNKKSNTLPDGVENLADIPFPPDEDYDYPDDIN